MEGVAVKVEDNKMNFYIDGRLEFYVRESGGVSYMPNCSDTDKVKNICGEIVRTSRFVREYLETIDQAPDFEVEGLKNKYKLLAQFNNTVLLNSPKPFLYSTSVLTNTSQYISSGASPASIAFL